MEQTYSACPAPAQLSFVVYDQDLHFCNHHAAELADVLPRPLTADEPIPEVRVTPAHARQEAVTTLSC